MIAFLKKLIRPGASKLFRFLRNFFIGVAILLLATWAQHKGFLTSTEDLAFDAVLAFQLKAETIEGEQGILWVDLDEAAHQKWGEPIHSPRDRLIKIMQTTQSLGPTAILLDIVLDQNGTNRAADRALVRFIRTYQNGCEDDCVPLFIVKRLNIHLDQFPAPIRTSRIAGLDDAVDANPLVSYISPYQELSDDGVVRRWRLWECATKEGEQTALLSAQLSACLAQSSKGADFSTAYANATSLATSQCQQDETGEIKNTATLCTSQSGPIVGRHDQIARRIIYSMGFQNDDDADKLIHPYLQTKSGAVTPALMRISATNFSDGARSQLPANLHNRFVIIGESHYDSTDFHQTPIGELPGALVIANAVHSMWYFGETAQTPLPIRFAVALLVIAMMSVALLWISSFYGLMIVSIIVFVGMLPISLLMIKYGIWFDFAIPLLIIQAYELFDRLLEIEDTPETEAA